MSPQDSRPPEGIRLQTTVHATGDTVPPLNASDFAGEAESEPAPLLPPTRPSVLSRLLLLAAGGWLLVQWLQGILWGWPISPWLGGGIIVLGGVLVIGFSVLGWQARRASRRLDQAARIRARFAPWLVTVDAAPLDTVMTDDFDPRATVAELRQLYRRRPLAAEIEPWLDVVDASWHAGELADHLDQFYAPLDVEARRLVRRESVRTGLFIAASPYPALDMLLVAWRNVAMIERIAQGYGLRLSLPARFHLYKLILRNIAFVSVTETMIDSVSQSWLSNVLMQVGARAGQGVGVALYSVRIGHQAMKLCRAVPERQPLVDRNIGKMVIEAVRERAKG